MCAVCTLFAWHGLSKYIEVKIKDKVANIRCPSKNYKQFLDPLFEGKSYQNHCLVSCVIFSASQPFYRLKKGATAQTVNDLWSYLINECQIVTQSKCPMCKKDFCFQCKTPWHAARVPMQRKWAIKRSQIRMMLYLESLLKRRSEWCRYYNCSQVIERVDGSCSLHHKVQVFALNN